MPENINDIYSPSEISDATFFKKFRGEIFAGNVDTKIFDGKISLYISDKSRRRKFVENYRRTQIVGTFL